MELILLVCLLAPPGDCRQETLPLSIEPLPIRRCLAAAPPALAEWQASHPKWRVSRWRCQLPGAEGELV